MSSTDAASSEDDSDAAESEVDNELDGEAEDVAEIDVVDEPAAESPAPVHSNTMHVSGRQLLDSCGQPFVVRGVEQILGNQLPQGNDWLGLVREIASTGVNAVLRSYMQCKGKKRA